MRATTCRSSPAMPASAWSSTRRPGRTVESAARRRAITYPFPLTSEGGGAHPAGLAIRATATTGAFPSGEEPMRPVAYAHPPAASSARRSSVERLTPRRRLGASPRAIRRRPRSGGGGDPADGAGDGGGMVGRLRAQRRPAVRARGGPGAGPAPANPSPAGAPPAASLPRGGVLGRRVVDDHLRHVLGEEGAQLVERAAA